MARNKNVDIHGWTADLAQALANGNVQHISALFADGGMWRDLLAFTWDIRTFENKDAIERMLEARLSHVEPRNFNVKSEAGASEGFLQFETNQGICEGYVRLQNGRAQTLLSALQQLGGHEEKKGKRRTSGLYDDEDNRNWLERTQAEHSLIGVENQPYVLIVGGGQGGLALGARLRVQGVPFLIVDRLERPGDQWRSRYKSLTLHDPVWYDHMPFVPFPDNWPIYTPKDKLGDFLEAYAKIMELPIWCNTEFLSAKRDEDDNAWAVTVKRNGKEINLHPTHIVLAVGNAGFPTTPDFQGATEFKGQQLHSSEFSSGEPFVRKKVVVIGANNSAHDICADLVEHGIQPVMIQRSSTLVLRGETNSEMAKPLYSEEAVDAGLTTEKADFLNASVPLRMSEQHQKSVWKEIAEKDRDFYRSLTDAGFQIDFGDDGTGLFMKYLRTASGYYIDVGASAMIADGRIALRSKVGVSHLTADGLVLEDGSRLDADVIIYATGFRSMGEWVKRLISPEIAEKIGPCWGYGSGAYGDPGPWEGELRNMWKPTAQEGLWFHGGNLQQSRFYSHYLALQLKARFENLNVELY